MPNIAVIGAGPGGCILARLLHTHNIPCTIFEAESSTNHRSQGGTLDLRTDTGLMAVKEAGLWEEFQKYARYDGESLLITDKKLTTWMRRKPGKPEQKHNPQQAPEIDRNDLRKLLLASISKESIRWGMKLTHVQETDAGHELHFANGEVERGFDLIVGCDGAFSKTRSLLTEQKVFYTGLSGWSMQVSNASVKAPALNKLVNRGSILAFSDGKCMSIQQLSSDTILFSTYGPHKEDYSSTCGIDPRDLDSVKAGLREEYDDWRPELVDAIEKADSEAMWRTLYMLPVGFTWPHKEGVTLLGDAAHVMTPFEGIGVNTAFHDAMLLVEQIVGFTISPKSGSLDSRIVAYEKEMFKHAHEAQKKTEDSMNDMMFTPGAPRTTIEPWIVRHMKEDTPGWSHGILTPMVYAGFRCYKLVV
ncbi:FAD/NAD(P)-binding domain-containing protein [Ophiobolus disseminans]|uniref:FAD/NAD(P)-binding domain-containing protein n=1 Tax=Ophiobolus disseminans TaxID=1469910 RepID=A0A6A7A467_9PLEO|nr:FAD/NAD(P)-binding domain-containing protein [Ophiobolus disseminans]